MKLLDRRARGTEFVALPFRSVLNSPAQWRRLAHKMADEVVEKVTAKWARYGLPGSGKPIWK